MRRAIVVALVVVAAVAAVGVAAGAGVGHTDQPAQGGQQVTICHATGNDAFVQISVDADSIIKGTGHGGHERDIIPPFDYVDQGQSGHYPGQIWPEGQATWENGCVVPGAPAPEPIGVFVTCIDNNADGTFSAVFGYESANAAAVTIAAGPSNDVSPGGPDQGQPTSFQPGNVASAFTVDGVSEGGDVTWTLVYGGQTSTATASASFAEKCGGTPPEPPPAKVAIFVKCVDNSSGTFSATFGYENDASEPVRVPVGPQNRFSPAPIDRGQTDSFLPGRVDAAFTVSGVADGTSLVWSVGTGNSSVTATATADFAEKCSGTPPPSQPVSIFVTCVTSGSSTFNAEFGYLNKNGQAVTVPVGSGNRFSPAPEDRGQTTSFQPGRVATAFTVTGIPNGTSLVWTLSYAGSTRTATATAGFATKCGAAPETEKGIGVVVTCVTTGAATYDARFGYENENPAAVTVAVGSNNRFSPEPANRGQTTSFQHGVVAAAFAVADIPNGTSLTWSVTHGGVTGTATATAGFATKCAGPLPPEPPVETARPIGVFVVCVTNHGATYDAQFGYQNDNAGAVEIPVGSANHFAPAPADRGQTTTFQPGNIQHAFTVTGIPSAQEAAWSVTNASVTRVADATASYQEKCSQPPQPAVPIGIFACVTDHGSTYDVTFGYENDNGADVSIPVSSANFVEPAPINRGQPELFAPGKVTSAFTVRGVANGGTIAWALSFRGTTVLVVTRSYPVKCGAAGRELAVVPVPLCIVRSGSTYTAVFGYVNQNPGAVVVPVGASNGIVPAPIDHGQPSVFRAGSVFNAFVSKNLPVGRAISWIVKSAGETRRATVSASLGRSCTLAPRINLALAKSATPTSVLVGDRVTYTIVVRNRGALTAQAATVVDRPLDARVTLVSAETSRGSCRLTDQQVVCALGALGPTATATIVVTATAAQPGTSRNRATVTSNPADVPADDTDTATVEIQARPATPPSGGVACGSRKC